MHCRFVAELTKFLLPFSVGVRLVVSDTDREPETFLSIGWRMSTAHHAINLRMLLDQVAAV